MMTTAMIVAAALALLLAAYLGWRWWQAQVARAAVTGLQDTAQRVAALALSDPKDGGQLLWEAGQPSYYPAPSSVQEQALFQAWEMALEHHLQQPSQPVAALPQQLDPLLPAMLPTSNLGLYTATPRTYSERLRNMRALAATSLLIERRAGRWLTLNEQAVSELAAQLQQEDTLEAVRLEQWRRRVQQ